MMEKLSAEEFLLNYENVLHRLNNALKKSNRKREDVILLAATKTVDFETINFAINSGIEYIGENKVQELLNKHNYVISAHKHFIGHLQTNKVRDIIDKVDMIESVDSVRLAREISKQAVRVGKVMNVLLEVNIGEEESKSGFSVNELDEAIKEISQLENICINGLMTIPPICDNSEDCRKYFKKMYKLFIDISRKKIDNSNIYVLSMGMSDDFDIAVEEGSTLVRVGTALFGKRIYNK